MYVTWENEMKQLPLQKMGNTGDGEVSGGNLRSQFWCNCQVGKYEYEPKDQTTEWIKEGICIHI